MINTPLDLSRLAPGLLINTRYRIVRALGQGGMGTVWEAVDEELDQEVALKFLRPELKDKAPYVESLKREILAARQVTAKTVCKAYQLEHVTLTSGQELPFVIMELVKGEALTRLIDRRHEISEIEATRIAAQICKGLRAIHELNMVHLDLKPDNVMLTSSGAVKLMDLGLAGAIGEELWAGSLFYLAPELFQKHAQATYKADIYAFGIVLHELLTGRHPFLEDDRKKIHNSELIRRQMDLRSVQMKMRDVHSSLQQIILRCIAFKLEERPNSIQEIETALEESRKRYQSWVPEPGKALPNRPSLRLVERLEENPLGSFWTGVDDHLGFQTVQLFRSDIGLDELDQILSNEKSVRRLEERSGLPRASASDKRAIPYFVAWQACENQRPLVEWLATSEPTRPERLDLCRQMVSIVSRLHRIGVTHLGLRPEAFLVSSQPTKPPIVQLRDLGIDQALPTQSAATAPVRHQDALQYQAPELTPTATSDSRSPQTDIFSLGVIFSRLLDGSLYSAPTQDYTSEALGALSTVLSKMLADRREDRYPDGPALEKEFLLSLDRQNQLELEETLRLLSLDIEDKATELQQAEKARLEDRQKIDVLEEVAERKSHLLRRSQIQLAGSAMGSLLILGLAILLFAMQRARFEKKLVTEVSTFTTALLEIPDPYKGMGEAITAKDLLDTALERIDSSPFSSPLITAKFRMAIGLSLQGLGYQEEPAKILESTLGVFEAEGDRESLVDNLEGLALNSIESLDGEKAERLVQRALSVSEETPISQIRKTKLQQTLARTLEAQGELSAAEAVKRRVLEIRQELRSQPGLSEKELHDFEVVVADALSSLAVNLYYQERFDESHDLLREAEEIQAVRRSNRLLYVAINLANVQMEQRKLKEAQQSLEEALIQSKEILGEDHPRISDILAGIGWAYDALGDLDKAEEYFRKAMTKRLTHWPKSHPVIGQALQTLTDVLVRKGEFQKAADSYESVLEIYESKFPPNDSRILEVKRDLAWTLQEIDPVESENLYEEILSERQKGLENQKQAGRQTQDEEFEISIVQSDLADLMVKTGELDRAEKLYKTVISRRIGLNDGKEETFAIGRAIERRGDLETVRRNWIAAEHEYRRSLRIYDSDHQDGLDSGRMRSKLALTLAHQSRLLEARQEMTRAVEIFLGYEDHWEKDVADAIDGVILLKDGKSRQAQKKFALAIEQLEQKLGPRAQETSWAREMIKASQTK